MSATLDKILHSLFGVRGKIVRKTTEEGSYMKKTDTDILKVFFTLLLLLWRENQISSMCAFLQNLKAMTELKRLVN